MRTTRILLLVLVVSLLGCSRVPKAPSGLTATEIESGILLKWQDNSSNEDGFMVFRNDSLIAHPTRTRSMYFLDTHKIYGDTVCYLVRAYNSYGASESNKVKIFLEKPGGKLYKIYDLEVTPAFHKVMISWQDSSKGVLAYQIFRNDTSLASISANETTFLDTTVTYARRYIYKIRSISYKDTSDWVEVSTKTLGSWRAIWDRVLWYTTPDSEYIFANGYLLVQIESGLMKKIYIGSDTTVDFISPVYPCVGVFSFGITKEGDTLFSNLSEVVCKEKE